MPKPGPNLTIGFLIFVLVFAISAGGLYALDEMVQPEKTAAEADGNSEGPGGLPGAPGQVRVVAQNLSFDKRVINGSANANETVTFVNQDAGVSHNISFYVKKGGAKIPGATGNLIVGPANEDVSFTAPAAGNYYFQC